METIWILGDQLSHRHAALVGGPRNDAVVLMVESQERCRRVRYHQQKLVLILSAMRHFAAELRAAGWQVDYHELPVAPDFASVLEQHLERFDSRRLVLMEPNDWPMAQVVDSLGKSLKIPLDCLTANFFLCPRNDFRRWAGKGKRLVMENHYRRMRRELGYLVGDDGKPEGGSWNFDADNRRTAADFARQQPRVTSRSERASADAVTREVIDLVAREFPDHPGKADAFWLPVDRVGARRWLERFIAERLPDFGAFEDVMIEGEPVLFHSVLSPLLNIGLLSPAECVEAALAAYARGDAPLNSVEGFTRQIVGWREFINGVYWLKMPKYVDGNGLAAHRALPAWFYTGETDLNCVRQSLRQVIDTAYNHHIQRLMVLGNFLILTAIDPRQALNWYLEMYCDAFDWVMAANVIGMALHADGGFMATKPYVAGSGYISKMSDYCAGCRFRPKIKTGPTACPFNYLYWDFFARHAALFRSNPRVSMAVRSWENKSAAEQAGVRESARDFLEQLGA